MEGVSADLGAEARCAIHGDRPAVEACPRCGAFACAACLAGPVPLACPSCRDREAQRFWAVPWEARAEIGWASAYGRTFRDVLLHPLASLGRLSAGTGRWYDPLSYLALSLLFASALALTVPLFIGIGARGTARAEHWVILRWVLLCLEVAGASLGLLLVLTGLEHLALGVFRVRRRGFEATLRSACYSIAPALPLVVPFPGLCVFFAWWAVLRAVAYAGAHGAGLGRVIAAVALADLLAGVYAVSAIQWAIRP